MHELSVTQSLLEIALRHAAQHRASRVTELHIVLGQLSSIVDDSVQFYWDIVSEGTICDGARLCFDRTPAALRCSDCNHTFSLEPQLAACPACGSARLQVTAGEEFRLESIDIDL